MNDAMRADFKKVGRYKANAQVGSIRGCVEWLAGKQPYRGNQRPARMNGLTRKQSATYRQSTKQFEGCFRTRQATTPQCLFVKCCVLSQRSQSVTRLGIVQDAGLVDVWKVTIAKLLSYQGQLRQALRADLKHWKSNHADVVSRLAIATQRPDLPVDRIPAIKELDALKAQVAALKLQIASLNNV